MQESNVTRAVYRESGTVAIVEVLADDDCGDIRNVELVCRAVLSQSPLCPMAIGDEWTAQEVKGYEGMVFTLDFDGPELESN